MGSGRGPMGGGDDFSEDDFSEHMPPGVSGGGRTDEASTSQRPTSSSTPPVPQPPTVPSGAAAATAPDATEVVFLKDNVSVHPTPAASERISGRLRLIKQGQSLFMTWIPYSQSGGEDGSGSGRRTPTGRGSDRDRNLYTIRAVSVSEMRSIRRHTPTLGWQYIIIVCNTGLAFPPLYFHNGGVREFLSCLKEHALLIRSSEDPNVYIVNDIHDPLQRSLTSLELHEVAAAAPSILSASPAGGAAGAGGGAEGGGEVQGAGERGAGGDAGQQKQVGHPKDMNQSMRDLSFQVLERFSIVTKLARETTQQLFTPSTAHLLPGSADSPFTMPGVATATSPPRAADGAGDRPLLRGTASRSFHRRTESTPNALGRQLSQSAVVPARRVGSPPLVSASVAKLEDNSPALVWARPRLPPLGADEWATFLDSEGRVQDPKALKRRIFHGGLEPGMRREVWKFLLGFFPFESTAEERRVLVEAKRKEYEVYKAQWQTISDTQATRFAKFRERRSRVDKDVVRTDRLHPFYEGEDNPNVQLLRNILITYSFYDFDLGYCQGMSDLLSPILFMMEDEAVAFWCFVALMERMAPNFHRDQNGMHSQLLSLSKLVRLLDYSLHEYLATVDCLNYFFCFRWILIHFKREFNYENVLRLWEVLWTRHLSDHFHLYVCVAILMRHRRKIMDEHMRFDDLLKFINELSGRIDLDSTLRDAEALCMHAGERGVACMPPAALPDTPLEG